MNALIWHPWVNIVSGGSVFRTLLPRIGSAAIAVLWGLPVTQAVEISHVGQWTSQGIGQLYQISISGNYAYSRTEGTLQIFDISQPEAPVALGSVTNVYGFAVAGNYVYATGQSGLQVLDVSNPANPVRVGVWTNFGSYGSIAISGSYAYLPMFGSGAGLTVIDISIPGNPVRVAGTNTMGGSALGFAVSGNYAYIGTPTHLQVFDIITPTNPVVVSAIYLTNSSASIAMLGNYAYVRVSNAGLQIIDVSNPANPVCVGSVATSGGIAIAISGDYAYCSTGNSGVDVVDISNPANPAIVAGVSPAFIRVYGVAVSGNYGWLGGLTGIQVIDISSPTNPVTIGGVPTQSYVWSVAQSGNYAYLADQYSGLHVVNVSNPANPFRVGGYFDYSKPAYAFEIAVSGNNAYMLDYTNGLQVFSISNPASPVLLGECSLPGAPRRLVLSGNHAYVSVDTNNVFVPTVKAGMSIIDVSTPTNPAIVATYWTTNNQGWWVQAGGVVVTNDYAYLTYGGQRWDPEFGDTSIGDVQVINVSNPANPMFTGSVAPFWHFYESWDIAVSGNYAYAIYHFSPRLPPYNFEDGGLALVDISNPNNPFWVGFVQSSPVEINTGEKHSQVVASGNNVWLLGGSYSPRVIDISNPTNMTIVASNAGGGIDLTVSGRFAYFASGPSGLQIYCRDCPLLTAELAGNQIMLKWPTNAVNFMVERTENVAGALWQPQSGTPQVQGAFYTLFVPATNPAAFFRLRQF